MKIVGVDLINKNLQSAGQKHISEVNALVELHNTRKYKRLDFVFSMFLKIVVTLLFVILFVGFIYLFNVAVKEEIKSIFPWLVGVFFVSCVVTLLSCYKEAKLVDGIKNAFILTPLENISSLIKNREISGYVIHNGGLEALVCKEKGSCEMKFVSAGGIKLQYGNEEILDFNNMTLTIKKGARDEKVSR